MKEIVGSKIDKPPERWNKGRMEKETNDAIDRIVANAKKLKHQIEVETPAKIPLSPCNVQPQPNKNRSQNNLQPDVFKQTPTFVSRKKPSKCIKTDSSKLNKSIYAFPSSSDVPGNITMISRTNASFHSQQSNNQRVSSIPQQPVITKQETFLSPVISVHNDPFPDDDSPFRFVQLPDESPPIGKKSDPVETNRDSNLYYEDHARVMYTDKFPTVNPQMDQFENLEKPVHNSFFWQHRSFPHLN